jgi:hypothetical protein
MADIKPQNSPSNNKDIDVKPDLQERKETKKLLTKHGGFLALKALIPDAQSMNPANKAVKNVFLTDSRFSDKRDRLKKELEGWLEVLNAEKESAYDYSELCQENIEKNQEVLNNGITTALDSTRNLEIAYRTLNSFFVNANDQKIENLRIINVNKEEFEDENSEFYSTVDSLLKSAFDRLSLKDNYSILVVPGYAFKDKPTLLKWAKLAFKYKVLLITDHDMEFSFEDLRENTESYKDSDIELQNVVLTANWVIGRDSEKLSDIESDEEAFFMPPSAALAGKLYDETANMAQGVAGKKYGTLTDIKGVKLDLLRSEIASLMDNQVVPMVFSEGRVMAFNNTTLYSGDNEAMKEYPIVRVFDWIKKVLMHYVHEVALENWDKFNSPDKLKAKIQDFLNEYQGYGKLFQKYDIKEPVQDPKTKRITVDINLVPYYAAKNFVIKLSADKKNKECETE